MQKRESLHEEKIYKNQEEQTYDDETQPLDNTDQITDADINVSLKRPLFGIPLQDEDVQNQSNSVDISPEKFQGSEEQQKNVLLSLDPLEADFFRGVFCP